MPKPKGILGKLFDREMTGKMQDVCYIGIWNYSCLMDEEWIRKFLLGNKIGFDSVNPHKLTAYSSEADAEAGMINKIDKNLDFELNPPYGSYVRATESYLYRFVNPTYLPLKNKSDIKENAFWILEVRGDAELINKFLKSDGAQNEFHTRIISACNNTRTQFIYARDVLDETKKPGGP